MRGTPKQVQWAERIQAELLKQCDNYSTAARACLETEAERTYRGIEMLGWQRAIRFACTRTARIARFEAVINYHGQLRAAVEGQTNAAWWINNRHLCLESVAEHLCPGLQHPMEPGWQPPA